MIKGVLQRKVQLILMCVIIISCTVEDQRSGGIGDPNCPYCNGTGYIKKTDLLFFYTYYDCDCKNRLNDTGEKKLLQEEGGLKADNIIESRSEIMELFTGDFIFVAPGLSKASITWVYHLQLDPINSSCEWDIDDFVHISNSKGWCGTGMQGAEAWEVTTFSLHKSMRYAIAEVKQVDEFYLNNDETLENHICTLRLELDEYNNINMSYVKGNSAPAVLYDENGGVSKVATFVRD